jgi:hypothetical protein
MMDELRLHGQNPWEADSRSDSQEISRLLWKKVTHCRVHKNPPLDNILSQMNPLHILFKIHRNIILPATRTLPKLSLLCRFSD